MGFFVKYLVKIGKNKSLGELRSLDRLNDAQLAAVELFIFQGLTIGRVSRRLGLDDITVRAWFRDPVFIAAANELTRAYCAGQLVPLALGRMRQMMTDPFAKLSDVIRAGRFAAELGGLIAPGSRGHAAEAGLYAPSDVAGAGRSISDLSAAELALTAERGARAIQELTDSDDDTVDPLS